MRFMVTINMYQIVILVYNYIILYLVLFGGVIYG